MENKLKEIVTKKDIVEFCKKEIIENVKLANNAALWNDKHRNGLGVGRMEAYFYVLQRMGYAVDYTTHLNKDYTIATISEVQIDRETIWEQGEHHETV